MNLGMSQKVIYLHIGNYFLGHILISTIYSTTHLSIFRVSLLKLTPILNSLRGSDAKGRA